MRPISVGSLRALIFLPHLDRILSSDAPFPRTGHVGGERGFPPPPKQSSAIAPPPSPPRPSWSASSALGIPCLIDDDGRNGGGWGGTARVAYLSGEDLRILGASDFAARVCADGGGRGIGGSVLPEARRVDRRALSHVKAAALSLAIVGILAFQFSTGDGAARGPEAWGALAVVAALYLVEAARCSTRRYLSNARAPAEVREQVRRWVDAEPVVTWTVRCYHYRYDHHHHTDSNGRRRTSSERTKVVTHVASRRYSLGRWRDVTLTDFLDKAMEYDASRPCYVKITFGKLLLFNNDASMRDYFSQEALFLAQEGQRDVHTEQSTTFQVEGFKPKMLAVRTVLGAPSTGLARARFFWLFTLLGLTVPYRVWFSRHCDGVGLSIVKVVSW